MGLRGPKPMTAAQLEARGAHPATIKRRQREERATRAPVALVPKDATPAPEPPEGLTNLVALAFWRETVSGFAMDTQARMLFDQACHSLQAAEVARATIATEGQTVTDRHGKASAHPAVKIELDHRTLFAQLCYRLGFLAE